MTKLFGVDFAKIIAQAMGGGLLPMQLSRVTPGARDSSDVTAGTHPKTQTFSCRGIIQDYRIDQIDGSIIQRGDRRVLILGGTLPANVVPQAGDRIKIEGATFVIQGVPERDPAAASYLCQARP